MLCIEGVPSQGGDYVSPRSNFVFSSGLSRSCLNIFVFQDNLFEVIEDLTVRASGFINSQGVEVTSLPGVTVTPETTVVQIDDANSEWAGY